MRITIAAAVFGLAVVIPAHAQYKPNVPPPNSPAAPSATRPPTVSNPNVQITPATPEEQAKRITREDAMKMVHEKKAVYVDVRSKDAFEQGHITGAISIPLSELITRLKEIPPHKFIITYCA